MKEISLNGSVSRAKRHRVPSITCNCAQNDEDDVKTVASPPIYCIYADKAHQHDRYPSASRCNAQSLPSYHSLVYLCGVGIQNHESCWNYQFYDSHQHQQQKYAIPNQNNCQTCEANSKKSIVHSFFPANPGMVNHKRSQPKSSHLKNRNNNQKYIFDVGIFIGIGKYFFKDSRQKNHNSVVNETYSYPS